MNTADIMERILRVVGEITAQNVVAAGADIMGCTEEGTTPFMDADVTGITGVWDSTRALFPAKK